MWFSNIAETINAIYSKISTNRTRKNIKENILYIEFLK
ncbi:hypothetical protein ZPR_3333 [Zunongwangia profunda SM-A87]|uniref:Uncharacterized protein n=1 Tax=Zunongwangia profunda (strain DSM 18752 / CCTCC AB 206139 / SM-A87) TaxID=655815 RepID=D5BJ16_ZUNPS|nr:hypothetical protein ZPR_3333 [Zunongwangia profunda SM-A87]